jgi:hypothetical protein
MIKKKNVISDELCSMSSNNKIRCEQNLKCKYFQGSFFGMLGDQYNNPGDCYLDIDYIIKNYSLDKLVKLPENVLKSIYIELWPKYINNVEYHPEIQANQLRFIFELIKEKPDIKPVTIRNLIDVISNVQKKYGNILTLKELQKKQTEAAKIWIKKKSI